MSRLLGHQHNVRHGIIAYRCNGPSMAQSCSTGSISSPCSEQACVLVPCSPRLNPRVLHPRDTGYPGLLTEIAKTSTAIDYPSPTTVFEYDGTSFSLRLSARSASRSHRSPLTRESYPNSPSRNFSIRRSLIRQESAILVRVGFFSGFAGKTEASPTNRFGMS